MHRKIWGFGKSEHLEFRITDSAFKISSEAIVTDWFEIDIISQRREKGAETHLTKKIGKNQIGNMKSGRKDNFEQREVSKWFFILASVGR